jgi:hypothetical protein
MAETTSENPFTDREGPVEVPRSLAETLPQSYPDTIGMAYIVESLMQVQKSLGELKAHVEQTNSRITVQEQNSRSDFRWAWSGLAAATVLLISALIFGYFKLEDKTMTMSGVLTKVEAKVDVLSQRPPVPPSVLPQR